MPLSPSTITDLRAELVRLRDLQATVVERIKMLEAMIEHFDITQGSPQPVAVSLLKPESQAFHNRFASTGLRSAALAVLRERGPMRAPDIAAQLEEDGFKNDSSTPLGTRVYNDLWRLSAKGRLKLELGVFSLPDAK
jgi:hypothetical protein